ncbi:MAG: helix-turn-helix domain-containing protein [Bacteroidota bacterium]
MQFGQRLKELRTGLNLSQKELSEKTGLTLRTIQRIENSEVTPSLYSIKVIGEALQTDLSVFRKNAAPDLRPGGYSITLTIPDMNNFIEDMKALISNHWKTILTIVVVVWLLSSYTDIKSGIMDAWSGN